MTWAVVAGAAVLLALWAVGNHNRFIRLQQHMQEAWHNIEVELQRRYELIPNLVETTRGYAAHEQATLERLMEARARAQAATGAADEQSAAERPLVDSLRQLLALAERYPELQADEHFRALHKELTGTENRIAAARGFYNANVREYEERRKSIPTNVIAAFFGFRKAHFWEAEEAVRTDG